MRMRNTDRFGGSFGPLIIGAVWEKGRVIPGYSVAEWRYDVCGKPMRRQDYGDTNSQHGWEIDHEHPVSRGGTDDLSNLQPLQWENNRTKGDNYPNWSCAVKVA